MILIISDCSDCQTYSVTHYLDRWGIGHVQWNVAEFPTEIELRFSIGRGTSGWSLRLPCGTAITRDAIRAVWYRKPDRPRLDERLPTDQTEHALAESRAAVTAVCASLEDLPWISSIASIKRADDKLLQLRVAQNLGLQIPDTLVTNAPDEAWQFVCRHEGNVAYKALSDPFLNLHGIEAGEDPRVIFTTLLQAHGEDDLQCVRYAPCLLQNYIHKDYELRVTVVDGEVFAAKIASQDVAGAEHDWRRELRSVGYERYALPEDLADRCRQLVANLGLRYGAIDLIRSKAGEYVFLEINPNGQYGWIEEAVALPISRAIARALTNPPPPAVRPLPAFHEATCLTQVDSSRQSP